MLRFPEQAGPSLNHGGVQVFCGINQKHHGQKIGLHFFKFASQQVFARPFVAPPGTEANALRILRKAFMDAMADKELLTDAQKSRLVINPKDGAAVAALVKSIYASPPALVQQMKDAVKP